MKKSDIYPGRLIRNLVVSGVARSGAYKLVAEKDAPGYTFFLSHENCDREFQPSIGDSVSGPVVVLAKTEKKYGCKVALSNFEDELFQEIYPDGWNTVVDKTPWVDHWQSVFDDEFEKENLEISKGSRPDRWNAAMPWAILPVRGSAYMQHIQGAANLFPDNLFSNKKIEHNQYAVYRPQTKSKWPRQFTGRLTALFRNKRKKQQDVRIFLHGFIEPRQWHYKLWKHLTDDGRVSDYSDTVQRWNEYTGDNVPETLHRIIFEKCHPPKDKNGKKPRRCDIGCPTEQFKAVCRKIDTYNETYLQRAVTFFGKCPSNLTKMIDVENCPHTHEFIDVEFRESTYFSQSPQSTIVKLILRGYCFGWNSSSISPTIHLYLRTFFVGPEDERDKSFKAFALHKSGDTDILAMAQFSNIEEVRQ